MSVTRGRPAIRALAGAVVPVIGSAGASRGRGIIGGKGSGGAL